MITDRQIKGAISKAEAGQKRIELRDDGERGAGRLVLIIRRLRARIISEWYAIYHQNEKRLLTKIGG